MKAVIGQFYKELNDAKERALEMKKMWKGRNSFIVVGCVNRGYMVISESSARACGIDVPLTSRRYGKLPSKIKNETI